MSMNDIPVFLGKDERVENRLRVGHLKSACFSAPTVYSDVFPQAI